MVLYILRSSSSTCLANTSYRMLSGASLTCKSNACWGRETSMSNTPGRCHIIRSWGWWDWLYFGRVPNSGTCSSLSSVVAAVSLWSICLCCLRGDRDWEEGGEDRKGWIFLRTAEQAVGMRITLPSCKTSGNSGGDGIDGGNGFQEGRSMAEGSRIVIPFSSECSARKWSGKRLARSIKLIAEQSLLEFEGQIGNITTTIDYSLFTGHGKVVRGICACSTWMQSALLVDWVRALHLGNAQLKTPCWCLKISQIMIKMQWLGYYLFLLCVTVLKIVLQIQ